MKEENIKILENMKLSIIPRQAIIDEMLDILEERNFLYSQGVYTSYVNMLIMMNLITEEEAYSLLTEID